MRGLLVFSALYLYSFSAQASRPCVEFLPLTEILGSLDTSGQKIIYSDSLIKPWYKAPRISFSQDRYTTLKTLLLPFGFILKNGPHDSLLITKETRGSKPPVLQIMGLVEDAQSFQPIANARLSIDGENLSAKTGSDGCFLLTGPMTDGTYLRLDAENYFSNRVLINNIADAGLQHLTIQLNPEPIILSESVVYGSGHYLSNEKFNGGYSLAQTEIESNPRLANDISRAFRRIPGAASGDFSPRVHLRGGLVDEVTITLDGVELYKPFHFDAFGGLASIVDSNELYGASVLTGGLTANLGEKQSGNILLHSRELSDNPETRISLNSFDIAVQTNGPSIPANHQWSLAIRHGDWSRFMNQVDDDPSKPHKATFNDMWFRYEWIFSEATSFKASFLKAQSRYRFGLSDDFTVPKFNISISDRVKIVDNSDHFYSWVSAYTEWNKALHSTHIYSQVKRNLRYTADSNFEPFALINNQQTLWVHSLQSDWEMDLSDTQSLHYGFHLRRQKVDYDYQRQSSVLAINKSIDEVTEVNLDITARISGWHNSAYISWRTVPVAELTAELGLRWGQQAYTGFTNHDYLGLRVNLLYQVNTDLQLRFAWGEYGQVHGIDDLQIQAGVMTFEPPQRAEHWVLGGSYDIRRYLRLQADLYRKNYVKLSPRYENSLNNAGNLIWEAEPDYQRIEPDSAFSEGIELALSYDAGGVFTGNLSYVYATVTDLIDGQEVPRSWDQRNALSAEFNWYWTNWDFNLAWLYRSAWPTSAANTPEFVQDEQDRIFVEREAGPRNKQRLRGYRRFDIRLTRRFETARSEFKLYGEVINLFDASNPCCNDNLTVRQNQLVQLDFSNWLPRAVSVGFEWQF